MIGPWAAWAEAWAARRAFPLRLPGPCAVGAGAPQGAHWAPRAAGPQWGPRPPGFAGDLVTEGAPSTGSSRGLEGSSPLPSRTFQDGKETWRCG
ncbi:hypothetical protein NDU88_005560 [Pleurodeles waltl]|uniref:Uncharacterized protein n=1 Tax=Pleurodeles waltl TaxID=8319 RepID=A0AAV7TB14_PLEWA|nr:hypothetical protein NDU88_005560 [Pleurodeles waltl]